MFNPNYVVVNSFKFNCEQKSKMPKKQSNKLLLHYNNFEILRVTVIQKSKPLDHEQANLDALWYLKSQNH